MFIKVLTAVPILQNSLIASQVHLKRDILPQNDNFVISQFSFASSI